MKQVIDFAEAVDRCEPGTTDTEGARQVAFVFLSPAQLFALWLRAISYKYLRIP